MSTATRPRAGSPTEGGLATAATGIRGFDELTGVGPGGVLTGSERASLETGVKATAARRNEEFEALCRRSEDMNAQIAVMRRQFAEESAALDRLIARESPEAQLRTSAHTALVETREQGPTAQSAQDAR